jgi:hypothetical protein
MLLSKVTKFSEHGRPVEGIIVEGWKLRTGFEVGAPYYEFLLERRSKRPLLLELTEDDVDGLIKSLKAFKKMCKEVRNEH